MRHHKRTPDNLFPSENALNPTTGWDCSDFIQQIYSGGAAQVFRETVIPSWHPYRRAIWNGSCDAGQLTREGLEDSVRHGRDFWSVYHKKLGFLTGINERDILLRTSTEIRTQYVASGMLYGMDPTMNARRFPVFAQPSSIDSIVPNYYCPKANSIRNAYQSVPAWTNHIDENQDLKARLDSTLGTNGLQGWATWYDHFFDAFASRTCHGHPLPCNASGSCVSKDDAEKVFALGDFEYNYIWNAAENSTTYTQLTFGIFFSELVQNFKSFQSGNEKHKLRLYIGHDGTMVRLASGLGFGKTSPLRWPAMGSEIVMEVWRTRHDKKQYVRVLYEGKPVQGLEWTTLIDFISLLERQVPDRIYESCTES